MLSSCLIVKNEESNLKNLIDQLKVFSDQIVIVDTGSTDKTREIAVENGCDVYDFKWINDFSAARNFSFSKAKHEWIFWCDGDDRILGGENILKLVVDADKLGVDWFHFEYLYSFDEYGNCNAKHWKPRLVRNKGWKWEKSVHENLVSTIKVREVKEDSVLVVHEREDVDGIDSAERNLEILLDEYHKDGDKTDPRTLYYLANTLLGLGRYEGALSFYIKHIEQCGWPEEKYFSMIKASMAARKIENYPMAINIALEASKFQPIWANAYFSLGETYSDMEEWRKAASWYETGFTKEKPKVMATALNDLDYTLYPMGTYAFCLLHLNKPKEAKKVVEKLKTLTKPNQNVADLQDMVDKALRLENFVEGLGNVVEVVSEKGNPEKIFESLSEDLMCDFRVCQLRNQYVKPTYWEKSIVFYCGRTLEDWADPSLQTGIGGSESAVIYLAREFAKIGYKTVVYNQCGDLAGKYNGVEYKPFYQFNPNDKFDMLVSWRSTMIFEQDIVANKKYVWFHDKIDGKDISDIAIKNVDKFIVLSKYHRDCIKNIPDEKVLVSSNGLDMAIVEDGPKLKGKVIYASSYDRGLENLLKIWSDVTRAVPEVTLDIYYGWDNFDKVHKNNPAGMNWKAKIIKLIDQKGVREFGRVNKKTLAKAFGESEVWAYPTAFWEISCITAMQAQASGAIPVCTDYAALAETVQYGVKVPGVTHFEKMTEGVLKQFKEKLIETLKNPINTKVMEEWAKKEFTWKKVMLDFLS